MRLVLDTNVFINALLTGDSPSARLIVLWRAKKFALFTAAEQIEELARVTRYPKIHVRLPPALAGRLMNDLRDLAAIIAKLPRVERSPDPDDNYLLALAEASHADYLVTGDKGLLALKRHKSTRIVTSAALMDLLKIRTIE
ncbi:MAG: putative toxin-antitoxin system toxin component, PIN family [Candidatus Binataceae bacterium]